MIASPSDLRYFSEASRVLNLTHASQNLNVSQPSLSQAIKRLEHEVGEPLFIRSKSGVKHTRAGKKLYSKVAALLQEWEGLKRSISDDKADFKGTYSIGAHTSMALNLFAGVLPEMMLENPNLTFDLRHDVSKEITRQVIDMKMDMGIVTNPVQNPNLFIRPLLKGEMTFWCAENLPETARDVVLMDESLYRSRSLLKEFEDMGFPYSRVVTSSSLEVLADLATTGLGIAILPYNVAMRAKGELKRVEAAPSYYDDHCFICRSQDSDIKLIQTLCSRLEVYAKTLI